MPCDIVEPAAGLSRWERYIGRARGSGDRCHEGNRMGEESPGSSKERCRVTPGGGNPRESATEIIPPYFDTARSKRCGKSAPRWWQHRRQGKPHREQNRIGTAYGIPSACRPGWLLERLSNGSPRGMVAHCVSARRQNPAYRPSGKF